MKKKQNCFKKNNDKKKDAEFFDYADDDLFMDEDDTILMIEVSENVLAEWRTAKTV